MDWRVVSLCERLLPMLGPQHDVVEHQKALPHREVGTAIEKVCTVEPSRMNRLAFEFVVLTAAGQAT